MDLRKIISDLMEERRRLDEAIAALEAISSESPTKSRRGRKGMGDEERAQVSERMKRYWHQRRKAKARESRKRTSS